MSNLSIPPTSTEPNSLLSLPPTRTGGLHEGHILSESVYFDDLSEAHSGFSDDDELSRHRARTLSRKQMAREHRKMRSRGEMLDVIDYWRPAMRSECLNMPRPCLYVSCRHHLFIDVNPETGSIKFNFPDKEPWELAYSCALDVADRGGITLEEVGSIMNLTRERIRQVEVRGLEKLNETKDAGVQVYADWNPAAL